MTQRFSSFREFYPFYLREHADPVCKALHFIGTWAVVVVIVATIWRQQPILLWLAPLVGYGFAWVGHFFFEHNKPATFKYPFYSLAGDWVMWAQIMTGKVKIRAS